ncbi:hypothetical protein D7I41_19550 [Ochrobactrum sp. MH181795]|nr:hypothetical protein DNK03_20720 [Brucella anthropi]RNL41671.1 hypothetical protein D7I41_19550 [Ochrobactrum sp. MH181795]HBQ33541.1 hypothetical protein [Brucella anthropi]
MRPCNECQGHLIVFIAYRRWWKFHATGECVRARFDLIDSDRRFVCFKAHLVRKPLHTFRNTL